MNRTDLQAYLQRDWQAVEEESARFWAVRKSEISAAELFALADRFAAALRELRPDWPSAAERDADLAAHVELARRFARAQRHAAR